jgi:uncharacterized protein (TIGR02594 family)
MHAPWMVRARELIGTREIPGAKHNPVILGFLRAMRNIGEWGQSRDETAWCAAFVDHCLIWAGSEGTGHALASSYKTWGKPAKVETGAIIVIKRKRRGGDKNTGSRAGYHVGFLIRVTRNNWVILGGNQGDSVSVRYFAKSRYELVALRRPVVGC